MIKSNIAKKCIPFPIETGHDKWLGICASAVGKVAYIDKPLAYYRRHPNNVTGTFSGVNSKKQYYEQRSDCAFALANKFINKFPSFKDNQEIISFAEARYKKNIFKIFKYRKLAPRIAWFEIFLKFTPDFIFKRLFCNNNK